MTNIRLSQQEGCDGTEFWEDPCCSKEDGLKRGKIESSQSRRF